MTKTRRVAHQRAQDAYDRGRRIERARPRPLG